MTEPVFFQDYRALGELEWRWPHFSPAEMACSHTDELLVVPAFLDWLEEVRELNGPMIVTSGYRAPNHQEKLPGHRRTGAHVDGMAVDVLCHGQAAHKLLGIALTFGALGVGVMQTGPHEGRYLHLDRWTAAPEGSRPMLWSY